MDLDKLRGQIVEHFRTQTAFAKELGWHINKLSLLLTGKYIPDANEIHRMAEKLNLSDELFLQIFFPKNSPKSEY